MYPLFDGLTCFALMSKMSARMVCEIMKLEIQMILLRKTDVVSLCRW